ncbi:MAG: hypothetical protein M3O50_13660 [Myxococcota bacterium]|nr:hypothetical protein [Myxococcota bacterium]
MRLARETVLELMALADGELDGDAKTHAEKVLADSVDARRVLETMRAPHIGAWLVAATDARASGADGIADAVMEKLADPFPRSAVALSATRARGWNRAAIAVAGSALALAAGVAAYVRSGLRADHEPLPVGMAGSSRIPVLSPAASALASIDAPESGGVEVNEVDSPSHDVSVFEIPVGAAGAAAKASGSPRVVIWIEDEPGAK